MWQHWYYPAMGPMYRRAYRILVLFCQSYNKVSVVSPYCELVHDQQFFQIKNLHSQLTCCAIAHNCRSFAAFFLDVFQIINLIIIILLNSKFPLFQALFFLVLNFFNYYFSEWSNLEPYWRWKFSKKRWLTRVYVGLTQSRRTIEMSLCTILYLIALMLYLIACTMEWT